ncbi:MAG: RagB/SusD family nutrient uptake outer membrane protein [Bacteroidales bacterium]|nr:RagB/SusD family nutrient uptake outer membrane protein [Bacteroidales bacterium]
MRTTYKTISKHLGIVLTALILITSCEEYLDKSPDADIKEEDVFKKFITFQGFVEDMYQCIVEETLGRWAEMNWNFSDDVLCTDKNMLSRHFDQGNYWRWENSSYSVFWGDISQVTNYAKGSKGYWQNGWYGIRKANLALSHLNELVSSQEEHDLIEGQSYFFRGYFHFEILRSWGGIPYIDSVFTPSDILRFPRLSYEETATKVSNDLRKAAQLLPASWDETAVGEATSGFNEGRVTKAAAYGYLGKNLLYEASPLMNGISTGTYTYNEELCKEAAESFLEVFKLEEQGYCGLQDWEHYSDNFYTLKSEFPIGKEILFNNPVYKTSKRWRYGDFSMTYLGAWGTYSSPTENYVENFGMANGLPIDESDSGYDPQNPWENRDPRFYYNILKDGDRIIMTVENADTYAKLFVGGRHRDSKNSISGYGYSKFRSVGCNKYDNWWDQGYNWECPQMRLADVYLMYAEAVNEAYGPTGSIPGGMSAAEALNIIRNRAGVPDVDARFLSGKEVFREIIRKERAVELAFESHRWYDNRRQYISHLPEYREKYTLDFDEDHTYFNKTLHTTIVFDMKHYWLPFPTNQVTLYPKFKQNPGW